MTQALILVNGVAASDDALPINNLVLLANQNNGGEVSFLWSIEAQPPGPADALTSTTTLATTLTPTKEGNYRLKLIVNQGLGDERVAYAIVGVLQVRSLISQPAAGERTELGPAGWSVRMNETIRRVDDLITDPGRAIVSNPSGVAIGTPVGYTGGTVILAGLPGERVLAEVDEIDTTVAADSSGPVGIVEGTVDGSVIGPGSICYVRFSGISSTPISGSPAAGVALAAYGSPATVVPLSSVTPGDPYRYVGVSLGADPIVGANTLIAWAGQGAWGGMNASTTLFEWNRTDDTQFSGNPLPGPTTQLGAGLVGGALTITADTTAPGGNTIQLAATSGAAAVDADIWWIDELIELQPMDIEIQFSIPLLSGSGDSWNIGFVYGGDTTGYGIFDVINIDDAAVPPAIAKHVVGQFGPVTTSLLVDDSLPAPGFVYTLKMSLLGADRGDTATYPPDGAPRLQGTSQAVPFAVPPSIYGTNSYNAESAFFTNPGFFPIDATWGASSCDRLGLLLGGQFAAPCSINVLSLRVTRR